MDSERKHVLIAVLQVLVSCEIVTDVCTVKILASFKDNILIICFILPLIMFKRTLYPPIKILNCLKCTSFKN